MAALARGILVCLICLWATPTAATLPTKSAHGDPFAAMQQFQKALLHRVSPNLFSSAWNKSHTFTDLERKVTGDRLLPVSCARHVEALVVRLAPWRGMR